jgi:iron complex outermembrane receptor protein
MTHFMMPFKLQIVVLMLCCLVAKAQHVFIGTVRSAADSLPLPAIVNIPDLNIQQTVSADGTFRILDLPQRYCRVYVTCKGYRLYTRVIDTRDSARHHIFLIEDVSELNEIVIYGERQSKESETANTVEVMRTSDARELGALSLSDGIAKLPGVSQLSTGPGISKPVVRGLSGNRIQTVLLGMRFDNQQWQDEHGLGLSDMGTDRVEIIKGPSSLFYGSEAMGGVIVVVNEKPAVAGKLQADISTRLFSNTYGYSVDAGVKKATKKMYWGIRVGNESHADYSDGNNNRILNSRFGGTSAKATLGFKNKWLTSENNYLINQSSFGFIMDAYQLFDKADDRTARNFERPHHTVLINLLSSQNTIFLPASRLKVNLGAHINNRQEQEGSAGISLDMLLNTYVASVIWTKNFNEHSELSLGTQNQLQYNKNNGSRIIVPDASLGESSLFAYVHRKWHYFVAEGGIRYDLKNIQTSETGALNNGNIFNPGAHILPVSRTYNTLNGSLGISIFDSRNFNFKINTSSGYRAPNLAELSSNGLHEGSVRYELGNTGLQIEQNLCSDIYGRYYNKWLSIFADAYVNRFLNYIYLQRGSEEYLGFRIYNYIQKNATISGFECGVKVTPVNYIEISSAYSQVVGQTDNHEYLPFIPAQKINSEVRLKKNNKLRAREWYVFVSHSYVFKQSMPSQFETTTPSYNLVNAGMGTWFKVKNKKVNISVVGNNLFNTVYYDHLSRYKYFGIYNAGRSISLNFKINFN